MPVALAPLFTTLLLVYYLRKPLAAKIIVFRNDRSSVYKHLDEMRRGGKSKSIQEPLVGSNSRKRTQFGWGPIPNVCKDIN